MLSSRLHPAPSSDPLNHCGKGCLEDGNLSPGKVCSHEVSVCQCSLIGPIALFSGGGG